MFLRKSTMNGILAAILMTVAPGWACAQEPIVTVKGYVLDSACAFIKNLKKPVSADCDLACAKAGSPLVMLADDGTIHCPISRAMPATGNDLRLMQFAGPRVSVSRRL